MTLLARKANMKVVKPEYTKIVAAIPHSVLGETMTANKIAVFVGTDLTKA